MCLCGCVDGVCASGSMRMCHLNDAMRVAASAPVSVCLLILVPAFLSVYLSLTSEPAHPPGQALWPVLRGCLKWAVAEMVVLWMEETVADPFSHGPASVQKPHPTQRCLLGGGKGCAVGVGVWGGVVRCKDTPLQL